MRISVICPIYNTPPALLHAAAESVVAVAGSHLHELILVDDLSTNPCTIEAIRQVASGDQRVKVIWSSRNGGPSVTRNLGIHAASAEWIGFTDSDDLWKPGRIEAAQSVIDGFPEANWIAGNYASLYRDATTDSAPMISAVCAGVRLRDNLVGLKSPDLTRRLIANSWLHLGAVLIRREYLEKIGGFQKGVQFHEDCILFSRLSMMTDLYFVEADFYLWRRELQSLMSSSARLTDAYAAGWRQARNDPLLAGFRRELRWTLYGTYKGLAINNLLNAFRGRALWFAFRALMIDPREFGEFLSFLRLMPRRDQQSLLREASGYSTAQRFIGSATRPRRWTPWL
jgi:glycosyltransferase involved in cell wall biosynthesis